jgi:hypothetical protein
MNAHLLIVALLVCPQAPEMPSKVPVPIYEALKDVAIAAELWGSRDHWRPDFSAEFSWTWHEWHVMADCPPASDKSRFFQAIPIASRLCLFNWECQQQLEYRLASQPWREDLTAMHRDLLQRYQIWHLVFWLDTDCGMRSRRLYLAQLRDLLGRDAYLGGRLPEHVPPEYFQR